jgi:hypothetical protein
LSGPFISLRVSSCADLDMDGGLGTGKTLKTAPI